MLPIRQSLPVLVAVLLAGCGYVGDPLPPALNMFVPIADLKAVERGADIIVTFTVPNRTTENLVLAKRGAVELEVDGALVATPSEGFGPMTVTRPAAPLAGRTVNVRVRVVNAKGRASDWSNVVALKVIEPLMPPAGLKAGNVREGVMLTWAAARGASYEVLRNGERLATVKDARYLDEKTAYGTRYEYTVRAMLDGAESLPAKAAGITPTDIFPPAVPAGLQAVVGAASVELAWDRCTDADFKSYRVYRSVDGGAWTRVAEALEIPDFSDKAVVAGKRHAYAVSAVDASGNESARSGAVEVTVP